MTSFKSAFLFFTSLSFIAFASQLNAQNLATDPGAVFKTHVRHSQLAIATRPAISQPSLSLAPASAARFAGSKYVVGAPVAASSSVPEAEEEIAIDPLNPHVMVAAISDFSLRGGFNTTRYSYSLSDGASGTWVEGFLPRNGSGQLATADGATWDANSDPVVAIDKLGDVYVSSLYLNGSNNANGFYVSVANVTTGIHFSTASTHAVRTDLNPASTVFEDKPWITVDNSSHPTTTGHVYASWTHFFGNNSDEIFFSRSTNHGVNWSSPLRINPTTQNGAVQGSQIAVGPQGEIYVVYEVFFTGGKVRQYLAKSTNGGSSFSAPVAISPLFTNLTFASTYRVNSFPNLSVNPVTGYVYVVYPSQTIAGAQAEFIRSTAPGALTFTAPVVINDSTRGQHFFPAIATDASGAINVSWFDTRNSSDTSHYDVYATRSLNNGATFAPNARVTPALVDAGSASFIGDYSGMAAAGGEAHPVWTSGGFNNGKLETATLH